ncbi:hypothetical protein [Bradyrhizobium icense]|uniref:hypothetical protein n=1 Tax=Bradyrhizobium icense TaxID=1274631 RepID=UPI0012EA786B|nr:hypothetical protein [Bradyrhizobium icense]
MLLTIAATALALQTGLPVLEGTPPVEPIQYRAYGRPPPCGHGWDLSARDGMCYPTGSLSPRDQAARQYQYRRYRGDRYYDDDYPRPRRRYYDY